MSLIDDYKNGKRYGTDWQAPSFQHMNDLVGTVSDADDKADNALSKSATAESNSSTALTKATTAETNSTNAVNTANTANNNSQAAVTTANGANTKSEQAISTANDADTKATNAETTANNLTQPPDVSEANKFGVVKVEIIGTGTNKKFKFSNLKGNGITNIGKTSSSGLQDTYTITYNDASTDTFVITNGDSIELRVNGGYFQWKYTGSTDWINLLSLGELSNVDQELSTTSTNAIANKTVKQALDNKSTIRVNNIIQSTLDFNSDPQTQIDNIVKTKVQEITLTGSTSGTITAEQLTTLQADDSNYIILNDEIYRLADKQDASGYRTYTYTGRDNTNNFFAKSITITISSRKWILVSRTIVDEESDQTIIGPKNFNVIKRNNQNVLSNMGLVNPVDATIDHGTLTSQFVTQTNYGDFTKIDFYFEITINVTTSTTIIMQLPVIFNPVPGSLFNAQVSSGGTFKNWERSNAVKITNKQRSNQVFITIDDDTGDKIIQGHIVGIVP